MITTLKPLSDYFKSSSAYWGERGEWLACYAVNRDSECLSRSNFRCFAHALNGFTGEFKNLGAKGSQDISDSLAIEEASHWACGWLQYLIINPADTAMVAQAEKLLEKLDDYPVLDENDFSELESEEADEVWKKCYSEKERVKYIREHKSQFEFQSLADLLGCVRGKYFAGYSNEILR